MPLRARGPALEHGSWIVSECLLDLYGPMRLYTLAVIHEHPTLRDRPGKIVVSSRAGPCTAARLEEICDPGSPRSSAQRSGT